MKQEFPDFAVGEVPDKWGNSPVAVVAYQHKKKYCGTFVVLECGNGSVKFRHAMSIEQARDMADMLNHAANMLEEQQIPYPEDEEVQA